MLGSLVEKSLLRAEAGRFVLLETIREYALQRLEESQDAEIVRRRHADTSPLKSKQRTARCTTRSSGRKCFGKLESERGNLCAALAYLARSGIVSWS